MATKLNKTIRRETARTVATKKGRLCEPGEIGARPVIIELRPEGVISFRVKGTRLVYDIPVRVAAQVAQRLHDQRIYELAVQEYNAKRARGIRARKPKKIIRPR